MRPPLSVTGTMRTPAQSRQEIEALLGHIERRLQEYRPPEIKRADLQIELRFPFPGRVERSAHLFNGMDRLTLRAKPLGKSWDLAYEIRVAGLLFVLTPVLVVLVLMASYARVGGTLVGRTPIGYTTVVGIWGLMLTGGIVSSFLRMRRFLARVLNEHQSP
jgi:hypothetical protein